MRVSLLIGRHKYMSYGAAVGGGCFPTTLVVTPERGVRRAPLCRRPRGAVRSLFAVKLTSLPEKEGGVIAAADGRGGEGGRGAYAVRSPFRCRSGGVICRPEAGLTRPDL